VQHHDLIQAKAQAGVGPAFVVSEFDLYRIRREEFDHRAHLSTPKATVRQVVRQSDNVKKLNSGIHIGLHSY
jgi:hypothetical protein